MGGLDEVPARSARPLHQHLVLVQMQAAISIFHIIDDEKRKTQ
jgi:hypothetical protein